MKPTLQPGLAHTAKGRDSVEAICRATHQRFIVDVATTEKRLAAKSAKAGLA